MASGGRHGPDAAVSLQELIGRFYCSVSSFFKWSGFVIYMVVLFPQYTENTDFLSIFSLMGSMIGAFYELFLLNFKK